MRSPGNNALRLDYNAARRPGGLALVAVMLATVVLCGLAIAFSLIAHQGSSITTNTGERMQAWLLAKAGVSLALQKMQSDNGIIAADGVYIPQTTWNPQENLRVKIQKLSSDTYRLTSLGSIENISTPGAAYMPDGTPVIQRKIESVARITRREGGATFPAGAFGKIVLVGNGAIQTDSFDARGIPLRDEHGNLRLDDDGNPTFSPATYAQQAAQANYHTDPSLGGMDGNIGSNGDVILKGASGNIWGSVAAGGTVSGDGKPVSGGIVNNAPLVNLSDPTEICTPPAGLTAYTNLVANQTLGTANETTTMRISEWNADNISVAANANVIVYLDGDIKLTGANARINIQSGGKLTIYQAPTKDGKPTTANVAGNGVIMEVPGANASARTDVFSFISASTGSMSFTGNSGTFGSIYAPFASVTLGGAADLFGAIIGGELTLQGNPFFHWDRGATSPALPNTAEIALLSFNERIIRGGYEE